MKRNSLVTLLGIALVVAIISTGIFYGLFVSKLRSGTGDGSLVVAGKALKAGTVLTATDVKLAPWPAAQLPKGAYSTASQVTGSKLLDSVAADEPVLAWRLISPGGSAGAGVPAGLRAVSVHVSDSTGVLALLRSGHKVDVQVVRRPTSSSTEVRTALENLQVLSVTPQLEQSSQGYNLPVVTLLASPAEADALAAADSGARVRLALRNPLDEETKNPAAVTVDSLMRRAPKGQ